MEPAETRRDASSTMADDVSDPLVISVPKCARRLNISEASCRTLIKQGRIRAVVIGVRNGKTLVPADEPEAFLEREARLKDAPDG